MNEFAESRPARAARPVSVRGGTNLREECTLPKHGEEDRFRSKSWSEVLNEFLKRYNGYRDAHLVFESPEGKIVRGQMKNAHQSSYGDRYYARLKALERQMMKHYDDLTVVMLTLTGSTRNANGGWRCPADHLRDVVNSWRPDQGRRVYHALREALRDYEWEYAVVAEKHKSDYGHVHIAVFTDGTVAKEDFHSVIDAHLLSVISLTAMRTTIITRIRTSGQFQSETSIYIRKIYSKKGRCRMSLHILASTSARTEKRYLSEDWTN